MNGAGGRRADAVIALVLLALAGLVFWRARDIASPPFVPLSAAFFPKVLAGVLAILALILLVQGLRARRRRSPSAPVLPALLVFGPLGAYLLLVPVLGFFSATFFFVLAEGILLGERRAAALGRAVAVAAGTTVVCYLVFERYLRVLFPGGLIG
ncbi:MAG TPA: tripartite tricarboxylate transporter TctB family protein [Thermodesulfobacteriota bacterium]